MELHYQLFPDSLSLPLEEDKPPVLIIPGLFGLTANWRGFARNLSAHRTVIVIDQRNHGRSGHSPSNRYQDLVDDLIEFLDQHKISKVTLVGHSMGGKVAMLSALLHPERIERLVVMDIAPKNYQHNPAPFLSDLIDLDLRPMKKRVEVERALRSVIEDTPTRLFILQSLVGSSLDYRWRLNLRVLHQFMPQITAFPDALVDGILFSGDVLFIAGADSDYVHIQDRSKILQYFPQATHSVIQGAGHWLHVEQPQLVLDRLIKFINL